MKNDTDDDDDDDDKEKEDDPNDSSFFTHLQGVTINRATGGC